MKSFTHFFATLAFTIFMYSFSNVAAGHNGEVWQDSDHAHLPCFMGTNNDCYTATVPISDLGQFCTYGHAKSNVFVAKKVGTLPQMPLYGLPSYLLGQTTANKNRVMAGDPSFGLPTKPNLPTPTRAGIECTPWTPQLCTPKFCPCYNIVVLETWRAVCYNRPTGGKD